MVSQLSSHAINKGERTRESKNISFQNHYIAGSHEGRIGLDVKVCYTKLPKEYYPKERQYFEKIKIKIKITFFLSWLFFPVGIIN